MSTKAWTRRYAGVLLLLALTAACGSAPTPSGAGSSPTSSMASPSHTPSTSAGPPTTVMGKRCGRPDVEATVQTVAGPNGEALWTGSIGTGGTVALLLHQTGRSASCGWWPFANRLAEQGVRAVMLDLCGFGLSHCDTAKPWASDYTDQVVRTVAKLRQDGATRVTVVGASLGGTVASVSAATAGADAVANLSGFGYGPMVTAPSIAALTKPVLGVGSHSEQTDSEALQQQVEASVSPTKRFVWADVGHGWSLVSSGPQPEAPVSAVGRAVIAWAKGDYTG